MSWDKGFMEKIIGYCMSDSHAQQGTNIIKFLLACWMLGDMISDLYTLITEYWAECAKEEGDCSYFIVGLVSLIAPTILALIVLNILFCSGKSARKVIATFTTFEFLLPYSTLFI